jgi:transcription initiation factor IIE alpha subunit
MYNDKFLRLPCSAKLVYKILEMKQSATFQEIKEETGLPDRTIREAIKKLKAEGLIKIGICLDDTRSRVYTISECLKLE